MRFHSDNETGLAPEIMEALRAANPGPAMPYGADALTAAAEARLAQVFECEVRAFLVASGTAANALALSALAPPYGAVYCHADAHVLVDECGAPEFYSGGARLVAVDGAAGKLEADPLARFLAAERHDVHYPKPSALSLTQASEWGRVYTPQEVAALAGAARGRGLKVHMDGTRFANAVAALGCRPAELSWAAGVDVLCFGASKNGAMAAEAVIFFDPELARDFELRRKRGGHLLSKQRFVAAQILAYLEQDRWLRHAATANATARRLAALFERRQDAELAYPVEANLVFVRVSPALRRHLREAGYRLNEWPQADGGYVVRLVAAFDNEDADLERLGEVLARAD